MNAPRADPKDPRFRAYRAASLGVYLVFTITFCVFIIVSVYRSVLGMTPERPPVGEIQSEEACMEGVRALFVELEHERKVLGDQPVVVRSDAHFLAFRVEWLRRKRALEARCGLESREKAREAFTSLDRIVDLYTTASVQFSGAVGPTVDEFKRQVGLAPSPAHP
jgi:hypothetical protein